MWEIFYMFGKLQQEIKAIINGKNYCKRQRIKELESINNKLILRICERPFIICETEILENLLVKNTINKNNAEIVRLEKEIAEDRYNKINGRNINKVFIDKAENYFKDKGENKMERKIGEKFYDGDNLIEVKSGAFCSDCYKHGTDCEKFRIENGDCRKYERNDKIGIIYKKIGENKMDKKEELLKRISEMEQREKDNQKTLEEMRKKVEELDKKNVDVSATGVYLEEIKKIYFCIEERNVVKEHFFDCDFDKRCLQNNNCFAIKEQAEQEALRREIQEFIRRCAMLWNKNHDWRIKCNVKQYYIVYSFSKCLFIGNCESASLGQVQFDTEELAGKCIEELNKKYTEEQLKVGFGVI